MLEPLLDIVFPRSCAGCREGPWPFCERCAEALIPLEPPWCKRCGRPTRHPVETCRDCPPGPIDVARSAFLFDGPARQAVHRLKFSGLRSVSAALAAAMSQNALLPCDVITWVPLARARLASRGYDQARALALALGRRTGTPVRRLLRRTRETPPQARRSAAERRAALRGAFEASFRGPAPIKVLLVDDVLTTGATAAACAEVLATQGVRRVALVTAARAFPGSLPPRYTRSGFPSGSVVARG